MREVREDGRLWRHGQVSEAERDPEGKKVSVKWARRSKGSVDKPEVQCGLVVQELGQGERLDELFAGTPSLTMVKLLWCVVVDRSLDVILLDSTRVVLYGWMRSVYIELPRHNVRAGGGGALGKLKPAMHGVSSGGVQLDGSWRVIRNMCGTCRRSGLDGCNGKEAPMTKYGPEKLAEGEPLLADRAKSARRGIAT